VAETRYGDIPIYLSDCRELYAHTSWRPTRGAEQVLADIFAWVAGNSATVRAALGIPAPH
jgi:CDP-paratose 2-epimerase